MTLGTDSSSNVSNQVPYLRTSRQFPMDDPSALQTALTKGWNETAKCVNLREIAIYDLTAIITGQQWFANQTSNNQLNLPKRLAFRQVYSISSFTSFSHNIASPIQFTHIYGTFTDGTKFYPLPYVNPTAANQVGLDCSSTQVIFSVGGSAPTISSAIIVLEYLLN